MRNKITKFVAAAAVAVSVAACASIDCPLNNRTYMSLKLTGNKAATKTYYRHTGYNGGLKAESFAQAMEKHPEQVIERAVRGMLPKTTLGRAQLKKLKVYAGAEHPHAAQNPVKIELEG